MVHARCLRGRHAILMTDHYCVTNDMLFVGRADRPKPCLREGFHWDCANPATCRGCMPQEAAVGHLCGTCWEKAQDAVGRAANLIVHLRSVEKMGQAIGERVDTTMEKRLILPETWMAADELMDALGARPIPSTATIDDAFVLARAAVAAWSDLEAHVSTVRGATQAVVLVKRMQTALKRWPESEVELRPIPHVLCPICHELNLIRRAPLEFEDEIRVECSTKLGYDESLGYDCRYRREWFDWLEFHAPIIEHIFKEQDRADRARRREERVA